MIIKYNFLNNTFFYIYSNLEFIRSSISFFIKTILLGDIFTFGGNSPFLIKRLIVEIEIPRSSETSLMVKKGRFCEFMWWEYGGNISKIL